MSAEVDALIQQAIHAEASINGRLTEAAYSSTRRLRNERGEEFNMFAISVGGKDIMYARTPELAKFVTMLIGTGDKIVRALKVDSQ